MRNSGCLPLAGSGTSYIRKRAPTNVYNTNHGFRLTKLLSPVQCETSAPNVNCPVPGGESATASTNYAAEFERRKGETNAANFQPIKKEHRNTAP